MNTPLHSIRCPDDLWYEGIAKAEAEGSDLSTVLRNFLAAYTAPVKDDR
jgi:hypothetical protein